MSPSLSSKHRTEADNSGKALVASTQVRQLTLNFQIQYWQKKKSGEGKKMKKKITNPAAAVPSSGSPCGQKFHLKQSSGNDDRTAPSDHMTANEERWVGAELT